MIDPVSEELERRAREPWPWRSSLAVALAVHATVALLAVFAPSSRHRALRMPSVQVRLGVRVPPSPQAVPRPRSASPAPAPESRSSAPAKKKAPVKASPPAAAAPSGKGPARPEPPQVDPGEAAAPAPGSSSTAAVAGTGGLSAGPAGEEFPYAYYLERLLTIIEGAWFRPPVPDGTRCRVLCRIDRSGRLLEAGIEQPSTVPTFDRAALRAVYAGAPYPPLPQGFGGASLTLHLEFGP